MKKYREQWQKVITDIILEMLKAAGTDTNGIEISPETPPKPELGDIAFPMFRLAKLFRKAPDRIAVDVAAKLEALETTVKAVVAGPYVNIFLDKIAVTADIMDTVKQSGDSYGQTSVLDGQKVMIEFSCPNTNKPLHLGHLRNDSIGESVSRIIKANGAGVRKVNLINDRGIHICKSMLAYKEFGEGSTPEKEGVKSDHYVGNFYVKYNSWAKENPGVEKKAQAMLQDWEAGKEDVVTLWKKMNKWAIDGIKKTYENTGISFDKYYFESETYLSGKDEVRKGLEKGIFFKKEDNSVWINLEKYGLDEKVLLRGDGTSLYITQDIGTAITRHKDWPFDSLSYVVASEQKYHFKVLFKVLELLGYGWSKQLTHLSYGMVNLPDGRMKSREGTVVDADNLLQELTSLAAKEIKEREREGEIDNLEETAAKIALGALNYYLLATTPAKDMVFDPKESISFNGNTGPYLQYTGARISSILRKFEERKAEWPNASYKPGLLNLPQEWEILKQIATFPAIIEEAGREHNPSVIAIFLYDLARNFSRYWHDTPVLHNDNGDLVVSRIELIKQIRVIFHTGFHLLGIPYLEKM